ncbi:potassium channel subfamily K member 13 [Sardina pilchardus]|uniref:potassium channel subfamily K member 13 n=1 Tax=Sardina pilchardus TaxID=27697 RepID=UPI002E16007B
MGTEGQASGHRRGDAPSGRGGGSCGGNGWVNTELARISLLWTLIALYMLFGAAVFSALEQPEELKARTRWDSQVAEFVRRHQVSPGELRTLLKQYEEANSAGVRVDPRRPRWDFSGSFYFVATVVSTIGFGMTAPCTICGKIFLIPYGLFGCAAGILFFNLFLERAITLISFLMDICHRRRRRAKAGMRGSGEGGGGGGGGGEEEEEEEEQWKPSVYYVTLILGALALLVAFAASGLYSAVECWGYFESMYFCFVTFSTMGFGDLVSGQREWYAARWCYQVGNSLVILLGVCCTYSLFNIMSIIIKQALNWMLAQMLCLRRGCGGTCSGGGQGDGDADDVDDEGPRGVFCCCCFCCYPGVSHHGSVQGQASLRTQLRLTATRHGRRWSFSVVRFATPATTGGKCWCNSSVVETVCKAEERRDAVEKNVEGQRCKRPGEVATSGTGPLNLHTPVSDRCSRTFARQNSVPEGVGAIAMLNNRLQETRINM